MLIQLYSRKKNTQQSALERITENTAPTIKSPSTISHDITLKLNQTLPKTTSSTSESIVPKYNQENNQKQDDLAFSITDIID